VKSWIQGRKGARRGGVGGRDLWITRRFRGLWKRGLRLVSTRSRTSREPNARTWQGWVGLVGAGRSWTGAGSGLVGAGRARTRRRAGRGAGWVGAGRSGTGDRAMRFAATPRLPYTSGSGLLSRADFARPPTCRDVDVWTRLSVRGFEFRHGAHGRQVRRPTRSRRTTEMRPVHGRGTGDLRPWPSSP
jgi:hypothetical protein